MRKKVWINIGDLVLISVRDFEKDLSQSGKDYERADVVAKYDIEHLSKLKKMPDINQRLFMQLETADGAVLNEIGKKEQGKPSNLDDGGGIEFDYSDQKEGEGEGDKWEDSDKELDIDDI